MELQITIPDDLAAKLREQHISQEAIEQHIAEMLRTLVDDPSHAKMAQHHAEEAALQAKFDEETRKIVELLKEANPVKIIRFGSAARGDLRWRSDLDLCVVLDRPEGTPHFEMGRELRELLHKHHYRYEVPLDFHSYTRAAFEHLLQCDGVMLREICKGEVVYERG